VAIVEAREATKEEKEKKRKSRSRSKPRSRERREVRGKQKEMKAVSSKRGVLGAVRTEIPTRHIRLDYRGYFGWFHGIFIGCSYISRL
jgi:hypothetical protein